MLGNFNKSIFVPELILVFLIKSGLFFSRWLKSRWRNDLVGWEMLRMLWLCFTFVDLCVNMCGVKSSKGSTIHQTLVTIGSSTIKVTWSSNIGNIYPLHKYRQNKSSTVQNQPHLYSSLKQVLLGCLLSLHWISKIRKATLLVIKQEDQPSKVVFSTEVYQHLVV